MVVFNTPSYYHALDRTLDPEDHHLPPIELESGKEWTTELGPEALGTSANPFQNQIQALNAKIREGASRIELNFPGAGKGNSQNPTPESYGERERRDIRELAKVSGIKTTTHATFSKQSFSGFNPQQGFDDQERHNNIKEIKKAIEFAADATTGGAVVFHTGEWNRPMSERWGKGHDPNAPDADFEAFEEEHKRAAHFMVDKRTGRFMSAIQKDKELFRPRYKTAKDLVADRVGQYDPDKGAELEPDDLVDVNGKWIDETDENRLFERVPVWDKDNTKFEVEKFDWDRVVQEAERWNKKHPDKIRSPEEMFVHIEQENRILQAKGSSLYHAQRYNEFSYQESKVKEALKFYRELDEQLPEDEKWKMVTQRYPAYAHRSQPYLTPDTESIREMLERELKDVQDNMRYVHEASASADAQARDGEITLQNAQTVEEYGLNQSTEGIARAGMFAYEETNRKRADLEDPIYIAPENWQPEQYGSHPDELIALVKGAREKMAEKLIEHRGKSTEEANKLAEQHIKSTIDIGHMNLWRSHFKSLPGESEDARNKRFNKWAIDKTKHMIKAGIVGHLHIADNLGWDDEHLTAGDGNAPIKEFVAEMEKAGFKDFIIEPGSFNPTTALPDTLRYLGSPVYTSHIPALTKPFGTIHQAHFGYAAPSNYIVGAYSPSNEWKLWSEVPLE